MCEACVDVDVVRLAVILHVRFCLVYTWLQTTNRLPNVQYNMLMSPPHVSGCQIFRIHSVQNCQYYMWLTYRNTRVGDLIWMTSLLVPVAHLFKVAWPPKVNTSPKIAFAGLNVWSLTIVWWLSVILYNGPWLIWTLVPCLCVCVCACSNNYFG